MGGLFSFLILSLCFYNYGCVEGLCSFFSCIVGILSPVPVRSEQPQFQRTPSQKGIGVSTDVAVIALPVATLAGLIIEKDWVGLKQGALTAATTVGASLILKYAIKEERPDKSNFHSFPSGHTSVAFANAMFLQRRFGWKLGVPAYVVATYVGWGRVFAKNIIGGMSWLVPRLVPVVLLYIRVLLPRDMNFPSLPRLWPTVLA